MMGYNWTKSICPIEELREIANNMKPDERIHIGWFSEPNPFQMNNSIFLFTGVLYRSKYNTFGLFVIPTKSQYKMKLIYCEE